MSCRHFATYTNGYGHKVCSDCGGVIESETTASDSTETPKRMKPLDKLEQKFYKILTGMDYSSAYDQYKEEAFPPITDSRECAQVAKDLARRAWDSGSESTIDAYHGRNDETFAEFLTSEGITE